MKQILLPLIPIFAVACGGEAPTAGNLGEPSVAGQERATQGNQTSALRSATLRVTLSANGDVAPRAEAGPAAPGPRGPKEGLASLKAAIVEIDEVKAHIAGRGWVNVLQGEVVEVDVLALASHAAELGFAEIPAGRVTQIRLHVRRDSSPYVLTQDDEEQPLKVPSGMQSGIKIIGPWLIGRCADTILDLELEARNALHIHKTGKDDLWILRPVIRAKRFATQGTCPDVPGDGGPGSDGSGDDGNDGDDGSIPSDDSDGSSGHGPDEGSGGSDGSAGSDGSDSASGDTDGDSSGGDGASGDGDGDSSGSDGSSGDGDGDSSGSDGSSGDGDGGSNTDPNACTSSGDCDVFSYCTAQGVCALLPDL